MMRCFFLVLSILISAQGAFAVDVPLYDFSIAPYSQDVETYLPSHSPDYQKRLLSADYQQKQFDVFYRRYFKSGPQGLSPWSEALVEAVLPQVMLIETQVLAAFDNRMMREKDKHYAGNMKPHDFKWLGQLEEKMNLTQFKEEHYQASKRAIAIQNTYARVLPDEAPDFYHFTLPGEGFPFDNLQASAIYAGTPLYVLGESKEGAWTLVITPYAFIAWVKSNEVAYASGAFIEQWQTAAKKGLMAISRTQTSVKDAAHHYQLTTYIGSVFPLHKQTGAVTQLLVPIRNTQGQAGIQIASVSSDDVVRMPLAFTAEHLAKLIKSLQNRPYGWGGAHFFNDCSEEMKSLFTAFGIWLPRSSGQQAGLPSAVDLHYLKTEDRLKTLKTTATPLLTLIYGKRHVMLYVGVKLEGDFAGEAFTYQNVWALAPEALDKRYVIGQSLFLPLLKKYPEQPDITPQIGFNAFKLIDLSRLPTDDEMSAAEFVKRYF